MNKFKITKGYNLQLKGSPNNILDMIERGVRSGLSYSGARTLKELRENARFIRQTSSGLSESNTHIMWRY